MPVFSFDKFPNVDKSLGPEMKSTGEAIYFIKDLKDPFFRQVYGERVYLSRYGLGRCLGQMRLGSRTRSKSSLVPRCGLAASLAHAVSLHLGQSTIYCTQTLLVFHPDEFRLELHFEDVEPSVHLVQFWMFPRRCNDFDGPS